MADIDLDAFATSLNDATRALYGGLWSQSTTVNEGNQGAGSLPRYMNDLTAIQNLLAGQTDAASKAILADIASALAAAPNTIGNAGDVAAAQAALQAAHVDILAQVANSDALNAAGVTQLASTTPIADPGTAPHATFADIGALFNDVVLKSLGGVNPTTAQGLNAEITAIQKDLKQLLAHDHQDFGGLTGIHVQTIINQLQLEKQYDNEATASTISARGPNDNLLDIIDIVQGDSNLAAIAGTGWAPSPDAAHPTTPYQDNAAQTNFWAGFIAGSNSLGQAAMDLVGSHDKAAINSLVRQLHAFEKNVTNFDAAQGGIFEARFDNELLGAKSTLGAEINAIIHGLKTGNATEVAAAAFQMHANAADVSGNNVPVDGGTFNTDGLTIAEALNTTTPPTATAFDLTSASGATVPTTATGVATTVATTTPAAGAAGATVGVGAATGAGSTVADAGAAPVDTHQIHDFAHHDPSAHHFGHMWG
jgi:hypothetical protein